MRVRPTRAFPSVIVALLVAGLAVGAGTARAADGATCTGPDGELFNVSTTVVRDENGKCAGAGVLGLLLTVDDLLQRTTRAATTGVTSPATNGGSNPSGGSSTGGSGNLPATGSQQAATDPDAAAKEKAVAAKAAVTAERDKAVREKAARDQAAARDKALRDQFVRDQAARAQAAQVAAAQAVADRPVAPVTDAGLLAPLGSAPGGLRAGLPTAGLFGLGTYDAGLLLAAPPGSPLRTLQGVDPAAAVTTTSQVQAMAFDHLPGGLGTPAVIGVLVLASFGGIALRHRVLGRRRRPAPAVGTSLPAA